jgi:hypothetical protein
MNILDFGIIIFVISKKKGKPYDETKGVKNGFIY